MKILVRAYTRVPIDTIKDRVLGNARFKILAYKFGGDEKKLDTYFQKNYNINLRQMCIKILRSATLMNSSDQNNYWVLLFNRQEDDKIANLITYGNSEVTGSKILRNIFI